MNWARGMHLLHELLERLGPPRLLHLLDTLVRPIEQAGIVRECMLRWRRRLQIC